MLIKNNSNFNKKFLEKTACLFLLFVVVFLPLRKAEAIMPVIDAGAITALGVIDATLSANVTVNTEDAAANTENATTNTEDAVVTSVGWAKTALTYAEKIAKNYFRKQLLDKMADQIIAWINGDGTPQFADDFGGFLTDSVNEASALWLQDTLGDEAMESLCNPEWAWRIRASLSPAKTFARKAKCSFAEIGENQQAAFDDFMGDFKNGGWSRFVRLSQGNNNIYGFYLSASKDLATAKVDAKTSGELLVGAASGFISTTVCKEISCVDPNTALSRSFPGEWKMKDVPHAWGPGGSYVSCKCSKKEIVTPAQLLASATEKSIFKDMDWIINNEEWTSYIVAFGNAAINRLTKEGFKWIKSLDIKNGGMDSDMNDFVYHPGVGPTMATEYFDRTPPTTIVSFKSSSQVRIGVSSDSNDPNEDVTIFYTTDGSNPRTSSTRDISRSPVIVDVDSSIVLRWFGQDKGGNKEGTTHTATLQYPLEPSDFFGGEAFAFAESIAVAISPVNIALIANSPSASIYYTTDGTEPKVGSMYYYVTPIIATQGQDITIKWFSVLNGQKEPIQTLTTTPTFPNAQLSSISDLHTATLAWQNPSTVEISSVEMPSTSIFAVNSSDVALVSNDPVKIYYTTDGSDPDLSSPVYTQPIEGTDNWPLTIKWFGIFDNNREITKERTVAPPFLIDGDPLTIDNNAGATVEDENPDAYILVVPLAVVDNYFILDPSDSRDNDENESRIVKYKWDFDDDGRYDWSALDWDGDGVFENTCLMSACSADYIGAGFSGLQLVVGSHAGPGKIRVKYSEEGTKTIRLQVIDDEASISETSITIYVEPQ